MILLSIDHLGRKSDHLPSLEDDEDYLDINIDGSGSGDGESFDHGSGISSNKWETRYAYVLIYKERTFCVFIMKLSYYLFFSDISLKARQKLLHQLNSLTQQGMICKLRQL